MDNPIVPQKRKSPKRPCPFCGNPMNLNSHKCITCKRVGMRKSESYLHELGKEHGLLWVGEVPLTAGSVTAWQCSNVHIFKSTYNSVRYGHGCRQCRRTPPEAYHDVAKRRGFSWIGDLPSDNKAPTEWVCASGHTWMAAYGSIKSNSGCPLCAKICADDYRLLAKDRGFTWIGEFPKVSKSLTRWKCNVGHEWYESYRNIKSGHGCPLCRKVQPDDYHALAKERGFLWIGAPVKNTHTQTLWTCGNGHSWKATYGSIKGAGGCFQCSNTQPDDYHTLAEKMGFVWIGEFPQTTKSKTEWQCKNGHRWKAHYNSISNRRGCPLCDLRVNGVKASKPQREIHEMIGGILNRKVGGLSIDVALQLPTASVAVEYDSWYYHGDRLEEDAKRVQRLINAGWKVLSVKSNNMIPTFDQIQDAIFRLQAGSEYEEIVLPDWGKGNAKVYK